MQSITRRTLRQPTASLSLVAILFLFILIAVLGTSCGNGSDGDEDDYGDSASDDDDSGIPGDNETPRNQEDTDDSMPTMSDGHKSVWNCLLCHGEKFYGAKQEPHGDTFDAPDMCASCHEIGSWSYTDPNAPQGHGSTADCRTCHQDQHDKEFEDRDQCLICHENGSGSSAPSFPQGHDDSWNCNICHEDEFFEAKQEPHDGQYTPPVDCLNCHSLGTWSYTDSDADEGHGSTQECTICHQNQHGKNFEDKSQCLVCHINGAGASTYPQGHDTSWDCYICHEDDFNGAEGEPHGGQHTAPGDCLTCHTQGTWTYTNPDADEGHGSTGDCLNCHQNRHGKTWTDKNQCLVCHDAGDPGPEYSSLHSASWDCMICHSSNFNGTPMQPHGSQYTSPDDCNVCHAQGSFSNPRHGPRPEDDHSPSWNCLNCHGTRHGRGWTDKNQCMVCHQFP